MHKLSQEVQARQAIERAIIGKLVDVALEAGYFISLNDGEDVALEAGYFISLNDGEEWTVCRTRSKSAVMEAIMTTDIDYLKFHDNDKAVGTVMLVYGNSGWDVICDYHMSLEHLMPEVEKLCDEYERLEHENQ